ncbi:MAG TPA: hypothetical protein VK666_12720 [Chryseolinea sp.]|nr:hypothetical protein [Chryseolinea sp.]
MELHTLSLLIATILMWVAVLVGTFQRVIEMPKWFKNPPSSFELIRAQSGKAKAFWIPLSVLFMTSVFTALVLNWNGSKDVRIHIIGAIACYALTGILSGLYFVKEVIAFTKIPANAPQTPELLKRTRFWLRWTTIRDVLQWAAASFLTIAFNHA